ncbi:ABC transporter ATP-binding protein [Nocardioides sp.]|uniref:ABC transporter ATP-binding protein n=1 Tax=Nocardioides sp. TaxID=35761 RepID=UPI003D0EBACB
MQKSVEQMRGRGADATVVPALRTEDVTVRYGGVVANSNVSIQVHAGEVVGLIGPNGAGKTSFVDAVTGFASYSGHVHLGGQTVDKLPSHARRRAGLARTWQAGELFDELTVAQNLELVIQPGGLMTAVHDVFSGKRNRARVEQKVADLLTLTELTEVAHLTPSKLSLGMQKLVGVARAVAADAKVVLLDEPAAGLSSSESQDFGRDLQKFVDHGVAILMIDHDMDLMMNYSDHIYVLNFGRIVAEGHPAQVSEDPEVIAAYLGAKQEEGSAS